MRIEGVYFDGKSSRRVDACLELDLDRNCCRLNFDDEFQQTHSELIDLHLLRLTSRLGNTMREVALGDDRLFLCEHSADVDCLQQVIGRQALSLLHRLESNVSLVLVSIAFVMIFVWALLAIGIPYSAKVIAFNMPEAATTKFNATLSLLDKTVLDESQLPAQQQQQLRSVLSAYDVGFQELKPRLIFRNGMKANAFALPAGEIILTDGLVNLAANDQELLAVYFHELGHLAHKHIIRRALQDSMLAIVTVLITGDLDTVDLLTALPTLLMDLSYSRQFEIEADQFAIEQLHHHGIALEYFAQIMLKLEASYRDADELPAGAQSMQDFLSTHPSSAERIAIIRQYQ